MQGKYIKRIACLVLALSMIMQESIYSYGLPDVSGVPMETVSGNDILYDVSGSETIPGACDVTAGEIVSGTEDFVAVDVSDGNVIYAECEHLEKTETVPATLYSDGVEKTYCSKCGAQLKNEVIPKISSVSLASVSSEYNGTSRTPAVLLKDSKKHTVSDKYYDVILYDENGALISDEEGIILPGDYSIGVYFHGRYTGEKTMSFKVLKKTLKSTDITTDVSDNNIYIGRPIEPGISLKDNSTGYRLKENTDYKVEFANNTGVGKADITLIGIGNYTETINKQVSVLAASFDESNILIKGEDGSDYSRSEVLESGGTCLGYRYTGSAINPGVTIKVKLQPGNPESETYTLIEGVDYALSYGKNNTGVYTLMAGDGAFSTKKAPSITITGKGNFKTPGKRTLYFPIFTESLENTAAEALIVEYNAKAQKPVPVIRNRAGKQLKNKTDFVVLKYVNELDEEVVPREPGNYKIVLEGRKNYGRSSVQIPMTIADMGVKPMNRLTYSISNVAYSETVPNIPGDNQIKVKSGKKQLTGYRYEALSDLSIAKALAAYENELNEAVALGNQEEISRLEAMSYVYYCEEDESALGGKVCFGAIPGKGLTGSTEKNFKISCIPMNRVKVCNFVGSMVYDGTLRTENFGNEVQKGTVYLKYSPKGKTPVILIYGVDYSVSYTYARGTSAGKVTVVITGNPDKGYSGSIKKTFTVTPKSLTMKELTGEGSTLVIDGQCPFAGLNTEEYTGKACKPRPVIQYVPGNEAGAIVLRCGEDYTLSYANNVKRASASDKKYPVVTVKGRGNYSGTLKLPFSISSETGEKSIFVCTSAKKNVTPDGTLEKPYKTVQAAVDAAAPGDTIYLRGGTYKENVVFDETKSGNAEGGYITMRSFPGEKVVLSGKAKSEEPIIYIKEGSQYISISDLHIGAHTSLWAYGVLMEVEGSGEGLANKGIKHITLENNEFYKLKTTRPGEDGGGANGILLSAAGDASTDESRAISDVVISGNRVHDNVNGWSENVSVTGNCKNITITGNVVYNNTNIGIDLYGNNDDEEYCQNGALNHPRNCIISGNVVYKCKCKYADCAGIYVDGAYGQSTEDAIYVTGNEVYNNGYGIEVGSEEWREYYGLGVDGTDEGGHDYHVRNIIVSENKVHDNPCGGIRIGGYSDSPENPESDEPMTGIVKECSILNNYLTNNGSGSNGYNGEIHFSKVYLPSITYSGNIITQGKNNRKYPEYEFEEELVIGKEKGE